MTKLNVGQLLVAFSLLVAAGARADVTKQISSTACRSFGTTPTYGANFDSVTAGGSGPAVVLICDLNIPISSGSTTTVNSVTLEYSLSSSLSQVVSATLYLTNVYHQPVSPFAVTHELEEWDSCGSSSVETNPDIALCAMTGLDATLYKLDGEDNYNYGAYVLVKVSPIEELGTTGGYAFNLEVDYTP